MKPLLGEGWMKYLRQPAQVKEHQRPYSGGKGTTDSQLRPKMRRYYGRKEGYERYTRRRRCRPTQREYEV